LAPRSAFVALLICRYCFSLLFVSINAVIDAVVSIYFYTRRALAFSRSPQAFFIKAQSYSCAPRRPNRPKSPGGKADPVD
jgi:hypothetical protein